MIWQYNSYVPLMLLAGAISLGVALFTLRRRPAPSSVPLGLISLSGAVWAWGMAFELLSGTLEYAAFFHKLQFFGTVTLALSWFAFAAVYTGHEKWVTPKRLIMLSVLPVTTQVLIWTSGYHTLMFKALSLNTAQHPAVFHETPGPWWWVDTAYSYGVIGIGVFLLASMLIREPGIYRRQVAALLVGGIPPLAVDVAHTYAIPTAEPVNLAPALFAWVGLVLYWGFTRYHLLDVAPAAREFVVKHMSDSLIVTDTGDRIVYLNLAAEKLIGKELGAAAGKPVAEVMAHCLGLLEAHNDRGGVLLERSEECEYDGRFYDGRVSALLNGKGGVRGSILVLRDSTDRRKAELALEQAHRELDARVQARTVELREANEELSGSRARLAHLLHSSPAVIYSCEPGNLSLVTFVGENLESQLGYEMEQVLGNADFFAQHLHPEDAHFLTSRAEVLTTGRASYEYRLLAPDGTYRWIHDEVRLVSDYEGRPVELVGSWLDVTDRRRIEERLGHSSKMEAVGLLAGGIAHDFNNLLTAIGGYAELAQIGLADDAPTHDHMAEIRKAVDRAAGLTGQLLAFSRKQVLKPRVINLNSVIQSMEAMFRRLIGENIEFCTDLAPDLSVVRADPGQIEQVCMNLIVNARDAMPQGGRLIVRTTNLEISPQASGMFEDAPPGSYAALSVSDTGQGIEDDVLPHLFEPFFTTKGDKGTGLGLATVYGIVGQSGGRVTVESTVGRGTTFVVLLPSVQDEIDEAVSVASPSMERLSGSEKLLVVEDEPAVRTLITTALRRYGFRVIDADGAMAAIELTRRHGPPDLLIADVAMPVTSGPQLADQLRESFPDLRVLYISGYPWDKLNEAWRVSNVALLAKPFTMNDLLTAVRQALA